MKYIPICGRERLPVLEATKILNAEKAGTKTKCFIQPSIQCREGRSMGSMEYGLPPPHLHTLVL